MTTSIVASSIVPMETVIKWFHQKYVQIFSRYFYSGWNTTSYTEEQVKKSFVMVSKALEQKNQVIHMLQQMLSEKSPDINNTTLQDTIISLQNQLKDAEDRLAAAQKESADKDVTIAELAHLLAVKEANQTALAETVHAIILNQQLPSMPATPRGGPEDVTNPELAAQRFEKLMAAFMQQKTAAVEGNSITVALTQRKREGEFLETSDDDGAGYDGDDDDDNASTTEDSDNASGSNTENEEEKQQQEKNPLKNASKIVLETPNKGIDTSIAPVTPI